MRARRRYHLGNRAMLRLLHTSDWHLGHTLHNIPRDFEHELFLDWLLATLDSERVDALVVAGDLFDSANPTAAAQAQWYRFVARARGRMPGLNLVFIGGNHDSASRLDAPRPVFDALGVRVVGGLPRTPDGQLDCGRLLVPLHDAAGRLAAWLAAVPFLRPVDLPRVADAATDADPLIDGVRALYASVLDCARARLAKGVALLAAGHCYMVGTALSEQSERKILGGNQHALPSDIFPADVTYAALGHLHLAQSVGDRENVRYSGSPLPLSLAEARYRHQVVLVELDGDRASSIRPIEVPRAVQILRVPATGALPPDALLAALEALPARDDTIPESARPYLGATVLLDRPDPGLKLRVERALEARLPRLLKLSVEYQGAGLALPEAVRATTLAELTPEEVFRKAHERRFATAPSDTLLAAFHELVDATMQSEGQ